MGKFPSYFLSRALLPRSFGSGVENKTFFDMIIVGGGLVGFSLAALAGSSHILRNKKVLLLESDSQNAYHMNETYEPRTVAINSTTRKMLENLGAWEFIQSKRIQPVNKMVIWESQSDSYLTFDREPLAHIVENALLNEALRLATSKQDHSNITVMYETKARNISLPSNDRPDHLVNVEVECAKDGNVQALQTSLLIGADGPSSQVREKSNVGVISWDHNQSAIVASLCMGEGHQEFTAWQRFLSTGPIALLPLSAEHSCLIWSTTNSEANRLMSVAEEQFVHEINDAFTTPNPPTTAPVTLLSQIGQSLAQSLDFLTGRTHTTSSTRPDPPHVISLQPTTVRLQYPLGFLHAHSYHSPRVALIGDAAHRILPLAGQGVNLGFGDAMSLIRHLEDAVSHGADIGSAAYLSEYTTERQRAVIPVAALLEALNVLYSTDAVTSKVFSVPGTPGATEQYALLRLGAMFLAILRATGLRSVHSSALLKNFLMDYATSGRIGTSDST